MILNYNNYQNELKSKEKTPTNQEKNKTTVVKLNEILTEIALKSQTPPENNFNDQEKTESNNVDSELTHSVLSYHHTMDGLCNICFTNASSCKFLYYS